MHLENKGYGHLLHQTLQLWVLMALLGVQGKRQANCCLDLPAVAASANWHPLGD
jgi:hypothetical protein